MMIWKKKLIALFFVVMSLFPLTYAWSAQHKTDWFRDARWGIMSHYLATPEMSAGAWNNQVNGFDVKHLAQQLKSVGAKYYMISIGQNSGHFCAPNSKYDFYTKITPSKCSTRDLISDIYDAIHPFGIKLMVYLPAGAPGNDGVAIKGLGWISGASRNKEFQLKWESVIREWSLRWGTKVSGWWFDGVYWPKEMYEHKQVPNFQSFAAAAKAGNSNSIVAFNSSFNSQYPVVSVSKYEDYTSGEFNEPLGLECENRWVGKSQFHILSYLGSTWSSGEKRYTNKQVANVTSNINKCGGVVTWDAPIQTNGNIPKSFIDQIAVLKSRTGGNYSILDPSRLSKNVALNKKAKLLNVNGDRELAVNSGRFFSRLGVDGDIKTFTLAGGEWPWTYQVDLAKPYSISRISVTFGLTFATEYKIMFSEDAVNWSIIKHEKNAQGGTYNYKISRSKMRYLRVQGLKPNKAGQYGGQMSIAELEAY
jgi:F5/8 type C domain/Alpha-L-fucosidase